MSLIQRDTQPSHHGTHVFRWIAFGCFCMALFLLNIGFGAPPSTALDASWAEVLAWAALKHAQWGRDIAFTYGPLGFLHGNASYFPGILGWFVTGQILLTAAFVLTTTALLHRSHILIFLLFAIAYACSYPWVPSDVSWAITLLFGTTVLMNRDVRPTTIASTVVVIAMAMLFGAIALIKFSLFPLWLICVVALVADWLLRGSARSAVGILVIFLVALLNMWILCGQELGNLPAHLSAGFEIASGYGHAMGIGAPLTVELAGAACIGLFCLLCLFAAYQVRRDASALVALALYMAGAFLAWRANFTRADHAHWFFAFFSLLPFALLSHRRLKTMKLMRVGLILLAGVSAIAGLYGAIGISMRWQQLHEGINGHFHELTSFSELKVQRDAQWVAAQQRASLPKISQQVGSATVDMFTDEQGVVLLNGLNYKPRPIFQSYSAYTPYLARLNEAYFLGPQAPEYVVMKLDAIDARLPMIEDPLALAALLQHYRSVLMEHGYLLLLRDAASAPLAPIAPPTSWVTTKLGKEIPVTAATDATIAFVKLDLSTLGEVYTFLLREPSLRIAIQTDNGSYDYRFIRLTGASGFMLSPVIRSTQDWTRLQLDTPLPHVRGFRIEPEIAWQSIFFRPDLSAGFQTRRYLRLTPATTSADLVGAIYPGFNLMPTDVRGISDMIVEEGKSALFLHAPGTLRFAPEPGHYRVSGEFGIRSAALTTPACSAADGIGISLVRLHEGIETQLLHLELDPFHTPKDRGAHHFDLGDAAVEAGDRIEYRVDPGHGGDNTACDWSYVRDLKFTPIEAGEGQAGGFPDKRHSAHQ